MTPKHSDRGRGPRQGGARRAERTPVAERPAPRRASPEPLSATHPWFWGVALVAAACVVVSVTYLVYDTDFWQHLLVGRIVWQTLRVPTTQIWTWPTYGAPDVNSSWGYEALIWPFWNAGGFPGLFVWRWISTLAAFALLWLVARRLGARGLTPFVVVTLAALVYRQRSQIRPETLVAILLALEMLILETRRQGGRDASAWIVPIAWVWANVHISYHLGFLLLGIYLVEAHRTGQRPATLWKVAGAALAVSFVNPFGWRALWQPFDYFLHQRQEPIYRIISELGPIDWSLNRRNGLIVLLVAWPLLLLWRWRRRGLDLVELLLCAVFTGLAFLSQRFLGFYALMVVPWLARDLDDWVRARPWPAWTEPPRTRAALAGLACVAFAIPEWTIGDPPTGIGMLSENYPIAACDWMTKHGVRGRSFNQMRSGGYLLFRFWPEKGRLPFIDVHQAGTREIRRLYVDALVSDDGWKTLDQRFDFDWALLSRPPPPGDRMQDFLDADSAWAMVFVDDGAAVYLKRRGALAPLAAREAYHALGAGQDRLERVAAECVTDTALRAAVRAELRRQIAGSGNTALAHSFLANLAMAEQHWDEARSELEQSLAGNRKTPEAHLRLATVWLAQQKPYAALEELEKEKAVSGAKPGLDLRIGFAYEQLGDLARARDAYRRELKRDPANTRAAAMLKEVEGRMGAP